MVARRFIAVFYPAAQFEVTTRITTVESEKFKTDGKIIVDPGWLAVYGRQAEADEEGEKSLVAVQPGEPARTEAIEVKESETKPPPRFIEATLLSAMEGAGKLIDDEELREAMSERGLGTPATRAQTIEGLIFEGYILRQGKRADRHAKGALAHHPAARSRCRHAHQARAHRRVGAQAQGRWNKAASPAAISCGRSAASRRDIVEKVRGGMGKEVRGEFHPLEIDCPRCGTRPIKETFRTFECPNPECKLTVWKTMAGRELERDEVTALLRDRRVGPLEGFRSKLGRPFNAVVVMNEEFKQSFEFENDKSGTEGEAPALANSEPLGLCPVCKQGEVYEYATAYLCEKTPSKQCTFRTGKTILQRAIPRDQVRKLITTGKTDLLPRFISKKNRPFSAFLVMGKEGKVEFEFEKREAKPKKGKGKPAAKKPEGKPVGSEA